MQRYPMMRFWMCWCSCSVAVLMGCVISSLKKEPTQNPVVQKEYIGLSEERQDLTHEIEAFKMKYATLTVYNSNIPSRVKQQQQKLELLHNKLKDSGSDLNAIRDEMRACHEIQAYCLAQNHATYNESKEYRYEPTSSPDTYYKSSITLK